MTSRIPISSKIEFFSITWCLAKIDIGVLIRRAGGPAGARR